MRRGLCLVAMALLLTSCSPLSPRSRSFEVSGQVTFEGEPIAEGDMTLIPDDPTLAADAGPIVAGQYRFLASAGHKRVEIRAVRDVATAPPGVLHDPKYESYIPSRSNEQSELTMEVVPGQKNRNDFALTRTKSVR